MTANDMTADTLALLRDCSDTLSRCFNVGEPPSHVYLLRADILDRMSRIAAHLETGGWMPIETAPKVGRILVWNAYFGVYSSEYHEEYDNDDIPIAERKVTWRGYPLGLSDIGFGKWYCVPSLWHPLPPPPK